MLNNDKIQKQSYVRSEYCRSSGIIITKLQIKNK